MKFPVKWHGTNTCVVQVQEEPTLGTLDEGVVGACPDGHWTRGGIHLSSVQPLLNLSCTETTNMYAYKQTLHTSMLVLYTHVAVHHTRRYKIF